MNRLVKFKSTLPFQVLEKQIIYVEDEYHPELNQFIEENHEKISKWFTTYGYDFVYIPVTYRNIQKESKIFVHYYYPNISSDFKSEPKPVVPQDIYDVLFSFLIDEDKPLSAGFIQYTLTVNNIHAFSYFQIKSENDLWKQFIFYIQSIEENTGFAFPSHYRQNFDYALPSVPAPPLKKALRKKCVFGRGLSSIFKEDDSEYISLKSLMIEEESILKEECSKPNYKLEEKCCELEYKEVDDSKNDHADFCFPDEANQIIDEIKIKINYLTQLGINEWILQSLFTLDTTRKLSRLFITKDYKIVLPDYNDMEIHLTPLPKAVFLLFLKHPEGILFKHLSNYKNDLMNIYLNLSNRESLDTMKKSIDDLVNPTKNAINEKCSRIREAFIKEFDMRLAENYFITGDRFSAKRIRLNRDLVYWETEI